MCVSVKEIGFGSRVIILFTAGVKVKMLQSPARLFHFGISHGT